MTEVIQYNPVKASIAALEAENSSLVFIYTEKDGNKNARSHIFKIRKTKAEVERTRVAAKKDALEYGRNVDAIAKELGDRLEAMIQVHQKPLDEIEEKETAIKAEADRIEAEKLAEAQRIEREKQEAALAAERAEAARVRDELEAARQRERDERIRQQAAEQARIEEQGRQENIRIEAAAREKAALEAQVKAEREKQQAIIDAERVKLQAERDAIESEKRLIAQSHQAERDRVTAVEKAEKDRVDAVEKARLEQAAAVQRALDDQAARIANREIEIPLLEQASIQSAPAIRSSLVALESPKEDSAPDRDGHRDMIRQSTAAIGGTSQRCGGDGVSLIVDELLEIMDTYHEQESRGDIGTPGGLEHMGDVWRLLLRWEEIARASQVELQTA